MFKIKTRLYCGNAQLIPQSLFDVPEHQAHYLRSVMRCQIGDFIGVFNGVSGEYVCDITEISKKKIQLRVLEKIKEHLAPSDITIIFALIKKNPLEYMIQKATELGVGTFQPIITDHTIIRDINPQRLEQIAIEASEQCGLTAVPTIKPLCSLKESLQNYSRILFCDERLNAVSIRHIIDNNIQFDAILIGPEGGFSSSEADYLYKQKDIQPISLGKRIMRAETATIAVISAFQLINYL